MPVPGNLVPFTGNPFSVASGAVLEDLDFTGLPEPVQFPQDNLTVRRCRFHPTASGVVFYGSNITVEDSEGGHFAHDVQDHDSSSTTLLRWKRTGYHGADSVKIGSHWSGEHRVNNVLIKDSWLGGPEDFAVVVDAHLDGIQVRGAATVRLENNVADLGPWKLAPDGDDAQNAAIFLENANGGLADITIEGGYYNGGGYILRLGDATGVNTVNTTVGPDARYGQVTQGTGWTITSLNAGNGEVDPPPPTEYPEPAVTPAVLKATADLLPALEGASVANGWGSWVNAQGTPPTTSYAHDSVAAAQFQGSGALGAPEASLGTSQTAYAMLWLDAYPTGEAAILSRYSSSTSVREWYLAIQPDGRLTVSHFVGWTGGLYDTGITLPLGRWVVVGFRREGDAMRAFIDGTPAAQGATRLSWPAVTSVTRLSAQSGSGGYLAAAYHDVRVYAQAHDDATVEAMSRFLLTGEVAPEPDPDPDPPAEDTRPVSPLPIIRDNYPDGTGRWAHLPHWKDWPLVYWVPANSTWQPGAPGFPEAPVVRNRQFNGATTAAAAVGPARLARIVCPEPFVDVKGGTNLINMVGSVVQGHHIRNTGWLGRTGVIVHRTEAEATAGTGGFPLRPGKWWYTGDRADPNNEHRQAVYAQGFYPETENPGSLCFQAWEAPYGEGDWVPEFMNWNRSTVGAENFVLVLNSLRHDRTWVLYRNGSSKEPGGDTLQMFQGPQEVHVYDFTAAATSLQAIFMENIQSGSNIDAFTFHRVNTRAEDDYATYGGSAASASPGFQFWQTWVRGEYGETWDIREAYSWAPDHPRHQVIRREDTWPEWKFQDHADWVDPTKVGTAYVTAYRPPADGEEAGYVWGDPPPDPDPVVEPSGPRRWTGSEFVRERGGRQPKRWTGTEWVR